jgi:hypothetical protein
VDPHWGVASRGGAAVAATTASAALTPLLAPSFTIGDYVAAMTNARRSTGFDL